MKLIVIFIFLIHFSLKASEPLENVFSLDMGACWLRPHSTNSFAIASFNENSAFYLDTSFSISSLLNELSKQLKSLGFEHYLQSKYDLFLHCGGGGHKIIVNIHESKAPLCVFARNDGKSNLSLKLLSIHSNPEAMPGKYCQGVVPGNLIMGWSGQTTF